jgi:mRNA interferase MazF
LPIVNVLPITSRKKNRTIYPNEVLLKKDFPNLDKESIILSHQIRTIDKQRLIKKISMINEPILKDKVYQSILFQIGYYS